MPTGKKYLLAASLLENFGLSKTECKNNVYGLTNRESMVLNYVYFSRHIEKLLIDISDIAILRDKPLGSGAFADVFEGRMRRKLAPDTVIAVKIVRFAEDDERLTLYFYPPTIQLFPSSAVNLRSGRRSN